MFCGFNLIKNSLFSIDFKNEQIKEKLLSSFILTFRGKWESIKHFLKKIVFRFSSPLNKVLLSHASNQGLYIYIYIYINISYLGFVSRTFTNHRIAREGGGHYSINSSLPLPPALQTLRHWPDDYCRDLTLAHS